jgi:hypothetical protein
MGFIELSYFDTKFYFVLNWVNLKLTLMLYSIRRYFFLTCILH